MTVAALPRPTALPGSSPPRRPSRWFTDPPTKARFTPASASRQVPLGRPAPATGQTLTLMVNCGDGATNLLEYAEPGWLDFALTHLYATANTNFTLSLIVLDKSGGTASATNLVQVRPPAQAPRFGSIRAL